MGAPLANEGAPAASLPARPFDLEIYPALDRTWPSDGLGPIATIIAQLPDPEELSAGTVVVVHAGAKPRGGLTRWLGFMGPKAHPSVRCTALLARGYKSIGAAADPHTNEELTWGVV
jgi:hypothetical protein